jgi:biopolymer transport protein ExbD
MQIPSLRPKRNARIEIIPLIDIMFFLLATFAMVSLSMVKNSGIAVVLPQASTASAQDREDHATISITDTGLLYLDKVEMPEERLWEALQQLKFKNPELRLFINGDQNARLGAALQILDKAREIGLSKVAFETRPKSSR